VSPSLCVYLLIPLVYISLAAVAAGVGVGGFDGRRVVHWECDVYGRWSAGQESDREAVAIQLAAGVCRELDWLHVGGVGELGNGPLPRHQVRR